MAGVWDVAVCALLCGLVVEVGLHLLYLLDFHTLGYHVDVEGLLCPHQVICLMLRNHPALELQSCV